MPNKLLYLTMYFFIYDIFYLLITYNERTNAHITNE